MRAPVVTTIAFVVALGTAAASADILARQPVARQTEVSVSFSVSTPFNGSDDDAQSAIAARGRRAAYEAAGRECEILLATIASSCLLERIRVNSNAQWRGPGNEFMQIGADASYRIEIKAK